LETVPCPQGDKGICTIPDRTAVVKGGVVSIQSREAIESSLPELDLDTATMRPLQAPFDNEDLIEAIDRVSSAVEPDAGFAAAALERPDSATAIVVVCSCNHTYIVDV
jgi:hypothetical protein